MRYLSICSGIEAASVAWHPLGWRPLAFSEIEAFPRAVLSHHYPDVPLHGDFTRLRDEPFIVDADLLVGGTPCQAFSIAGLRQSLSDDRGNLSLEFIRLANAIDDLRRDAGRAPAWILWENVPGVLSVSDNAFGAFLGGLVGSDTPIVPRGRWTDAGVVAGPQRVAAWRILDAQHFGLAQRRRRVFVLARKHPRGWACADALLPLIDSLSGHPPPRRKAGKDVAPTLSSRPTGGGGLGTDFDLDGGLVAGTLGTSSGDWSRDNIGESIVATALSSHGGPHGRQDFESETFVAEFAPAISASNPYCDHESREGLLVAHALRGEGFDASEDGTGRGTPIIPVSYRTAGDGAAYEEGDVTAPLTTGTDPSASIVTYSIMPQNSGKDYKAREVDVAQPLMASGPVGGDQGGDYIVHAIQAGATRENPASGPDGVGVQEDHAYTLEARSEVQAVAFAVRTNQTGQNGPGYMADLAPSLSADESPSAIAFALRGRQGGAQAEVHDHVSALRAASGGSSRDFIAFDTTQVTSKANRSNPKAGDPSHPLAAGVHPPAIAGAAVRRLTPTECCRLQGFPDNYLAQVTWRGACPPPDGPMYRALGNSMATHVMRYIGERIAAVEASSSEAAA